MRRLLWMAAVLTLAAVPRLAPAAEPAARQPAESGAASDSFDGLFAGTYTQTRRGASATQTLALVLRRNQTCTLTTTSLDRTGRPVVEQGTWSSDDRSVTVVLTETNGQQERNEITFEPRGDRLVATRYDRGRYGSEGLTLERKRAAPRPPPRVPVEGVYTENRTGADYPQKLTLVLNADRHCSLTTEFVGSRVRPVVETGSWRYRGGWVTLILTKANGRYQDNVIKFRRKGDELLAVDFDRRRYGSMGLTLKKQEASASGR